MVIVLLIHESCMNEGFSPERNGVSDQPKLNMISAPKTLYFEHDHFAIMKRRSLFGLWIGLSIFGLGLHCVAADPVATLPQTKPLEWEESDLSTRLMDGAHRFIERKIEEAPARRAQFWSRDFSSEAAYTKSIEPNREHFKTIIGVVDPRIPARMERFG